MRGYKEELGRSSLEKLVDAEEKGSKIVASMASKNIGGDIYIFNLDISLENGSVESLSGIRIGEYDAVPKRSARYAGLLREVCNIIGIEPTTPKDTLKYFMRAEDAGDVPELSSQAAVQLISGFMFYLAQIDKRLVSSLSEKGVNGGVVNVTHVGINDTDIQKMQELYCFLLRKAPFDGYKGVTRSEQ